MMIIQAARATVLALGLLAAGACANPLNRATYDRYVEVARQAEARGDVGTMETAYYRAAENVRWGHLGERLEGEALFNLGRTKRLVGKLDESEELLKRSLAIDEKLYGRDAPVIGFTLAELAATYFEAKKYEEGIPVLVRLEPLALQARERYRDQARRFIKRTYERYADELGKLGKVEDAERFKSVAGSL